MKVYLGLSRIAVLIFLAGLFLSGCSTTESPQNTNPSAQSNKNASGTATSTPAPQATTNAAVPSGYIDDVQGEAKTGGSLLVSGWAADVTEGAPVKRLDVLIDNNVVAQATLGKERADVVKVSGRPDWRRSGWEATVSLANVAPGPHKITADSYNSKGAKSALSGARNIEVAAK